MTKEDYVMFAVFNILFFQGIPLPWQTKRTVFRDRPFPIIVVNKSTRRVPLYINLIGINVIIIIIINFCQKLLQLRDFALQQQWFFHVIPMETLTGYNLT